MLLMLSAGPAEAFEGPGDHGGDVDRSLLDLPGRETDHFVPGAAMDDINVPMHRMKSPILTTPTHPLRPTPATCDCSTMVSAN